MKTPIEKLGYLIHFFLFSSLFVLLLNNSSYCQAWHNMAGGVNNTVFSIIEHNGKIYVGGAFIQAGGQPANRIAVWDGTSWDSLGSGLNGTILTMVIYKGRLIVGGDFTLAGGQTSNRIAKWDGSSWSNIGLGANDIIYALAVYNNKLIAGGNFTSIGGISANHIAIWNDTVWAPIGLGADDNVRSLIEFNGDLIIGGSFYSIGGASVNQIARWNGVNWFPIGNGVDNGAVYALTIYNNNLIIGGSFTSVSGTSAKRVARWNGSNWYPLGPYGTTNSVYTFSNYFGELIVGGIFIKAGNQTVNRIAKWNGTTWSPLDNGTDNNIYALYSYDGILTVGGSFNYAGDSLCYKIAQWGDEPEIPILISPPSGSIITTLTPLLNWQDAPGAVDYRLKLSVDPNFISLVIDQLSVTESQFQIPNGLLSPQTPYFWRVMSRNGFGTSLYSLVWFFTTTFPTGLSTTGNEAPDEYRLYNNYPNPFNSSTKINFDLKNQTNVSLIVYDMLGRNVETLVNEVLQTGTYEYSFAADKLTSGIYFYRITTDEFVDTKKMLLLK